MKEKLFSLTKKDFEIQTFRAGGKGGQKQNKTSSGVRIIHRESGAIGEARDERSQYQNKKLAFNRLAKSGKFRLWLNEKIFNTSHVKTIEQRLENAMKEDNLKVEIKNSKNQWVALDNVYNL